MEDSPKVATTRMAAEAAREHERLTLARRLTAEPSTAIELPLDIDRHVLVTFSRRRGIRSLLKARPLVVMRFVLADPNGQAIAYHLTPVQIDIERGTNVPFQLLDRLGEQLAPTSDYDDWLASSCFIHSAFWNVRVARERSIGNLRTSSRSQELQRGLFDLRAEHAWVDEQARQREWVRESSWFAAWAGRQSALVSEPPHIALALFTRRSPR